MANGSPGPGSTRGPSPIGVAWQASGVPLSIYGFYKMFTTEGSALMTFFTEVFLFGMALYIALVPLVLIALGLEQVVGANRADQSKALTLPVLISIWLALGAAIRLWIFAPNLAADLDTFGRAFSALAGAAMIAVPSYFYFRRKSRQAA